MNEKHLLAGFRRKVSEEQILFFYIFIIIIIIFYFTNSGPRNNIRMAASEVSSDALG